MKIIIKGTKTIEEYKKIKEQLEKYAKERNVEEIRWEYGTVKADGTVIDLE